MTDNMFEDHEIEKLKAIRHNDTDFEQFKAFQKTLEARHENAVKDQKREVLIRRLQQWDESTVGRWQGASLNKLEPEIAQNIKAVMSKSSYTPSFYIHSVDAFQGTYIAHAIIRRYIGNGRVSPSRVVKISEDEILGYANGGFTGRDALNRLLQKKNNVYIVDNCGARSEYTEHREIPVLEQFLSNVYSQNKIAICIGQISLAGYADLFSASGKSRLEALFQDSVLNIDAPLEETVKTKSNINLGLFDG